VATAGFAAIGLLCKPYTLLGRANVVLAVNQANTLVD